VQEGEFDYRIIDDGIVRIQHITGPGTDLNVYVIGKPGEAALVDAGFARSMPGIIDTLQRNGWKSEDFTALIITHEHADHFGGSCAFVEWAARAVPMVHPAACWPIESGSGCAAAAGTTPGRDEPAGGAADSAASLRIGSLLRDGDELQFADKTFRVLHTPGHAAGQIVLYERQRRIAIVGDLIQGAPASKTWFGLYVDPVAQVASLQRLADLQPRMLLMGHHPVVPAEQVQANIDAALRRVEAVESAVMEAVQQGLSETDAIARAAFGSVMGWSIDAVPSYVLSTVRAVLNSLQCRGKVRSEHVERWLPA